MNRGWLIVFAKAPRPGLVKTRLCPPLDFDQAAAFYEAMLDDVLAESARWADRFDLEPLLFFHPPDGLTELLRRTPPGFRLQEQRGEDLSTRMANAFAEAAAAGAHLALLRGSDSPALDSTQAAMAIAALESGDDLVLTPDLGGGYALIGQCRPDPAIFDLPMSTTEVLEQTVEIARAKGWRHSLTNATPDLDRVTDFAAIDALSRKETSDLCPRTVESIADLRRSGVL